MSAFAPTSKRHGFTAISMVITLVVVAILSATVVRVSWGFAAGAGGTTQLTVPGAEGEGPTATLPAGSPAEVTGSIALSTHAAAISSQANAAARLAGGDLSGLADSEILAGYPSNDGTNTVSARIVSRSPLLVELDLNSGVATSCVNVAAGSSTSGSC